MPKPVSLSVALVLVGCGGSGSGAPPREPEPVAVVAPAASDQPAIASQPPTVAAPSGGAYAGSPLTDLARAIQEVTVTTLDGRDPSGGPIPIERIRDRTRLVRAEKAAPPVRELSFIAFAMEVEIVLAGPSASAASDDDEVGTLKTVAFLSSAGLKLAELRTRSGREPKPLPPWLSGVEAFGRSVVGALQNRSARSLLVGEAERSVLGEALYEKASEDLAKLDLAPAERAAAKHGRPLGYVVDDVFLLARDAHGGIWGFQLQFDDDDGQVVLDSSPLVRVEKFEPGRPKPIDAPPPPPVP